MVCGHWVGASGSWVWVHGSVVFIIGHGSWLQNPLVLPLHIIVEVNFLPDHDTIDYIDYPMISDFKNFLLTVTVVAYST